MLPSSDRKIWSWVQRDPDLGMNSLAKTSSNFKGQTRPLVREGAPHQQTRDCLTVIKIRSWARDGCLTPRRTGRLTVGHNITLTLTSIISCPKHGVGKSLVVAPLHNYQFSKRNFPRTTFSEPCDLPSLIARRSSGRPLPLHLTFTAQGRLCVTASDIPQER
jgi:hypothetical protein